MTHYYGCPKCRGQEIVESVRIGAYYSGEFDENGEWDGNHEQAEMSWDDTTPDLRGTLRAGGDAPVFQCQTDNCWELFDEPKRFSDRRNPAAAWSAERRKRWPIRQDRRRG